ncbi:MAG: 3-isopropylmalate dehydratase large subunit [Robiginitomaculum sp.]|nr:MAG: 3-isopropylmalate dehydratase large subunit [Robiginitomaculum sp.]
MSSKSLFDKVWERHLVRAQTPEQPGVLYIDRHLVHEVTSPQAFSMLRDKGLKLRCPERTFATMDHSIPTIPFEGGKPVYASEETSAQVSTLQQNCSDFDIELHGWDSPHRGVIHVMAPELGLTLPGMTIVCGDSHTATHGAFGALAFGIGTTEVAHVFATQCLLQAKPKSMRVTIDGRLTDGITAKDMALAVIAALSASGGTGYVIEYAGEAVRALGMEGRMTLCNMSIEAGARAGMIAPDEVTFNWLQGRTHAPEGQAWEEAIADWKTLCTDDKAVFDKEISLRGQHIAPMITYGPSPDQAMAVDSITPNPAGNVEAEGLDYMQFTAGRPVLGEKVDVVFIGSCTNGRLSDLWEVAHVLKGRKIHKRVRMLIVPGSEQVRRNAESEGLHDIFIAAGAEWRLPGCSMCIAMNGDMAQPGELVVSTSNRNFKGRQGKGARTVLASPATAAACAVWGEVADPRPFRETPHVA